MRLVDPEQLSAVIGQIYDAALDSSSWPVALEGVASFVGGAAAMIFWQDAILAKGGRYHSWGDDPAYTKSYFETYIALSPVRKIQYLIPVGKITSISQIVGTRQMRESQFFQEWMSPQGYADNVLTNLDRSSTSLAAFAVARHERDGLVDAQTRRRMALLAPHVRRAVLIGKLADLRRVETETWSRLLDGIDAGIFLVDARGRVVHQNTLADAMVDEADLVALAGGRLQCLDRPHVREFREFQLLATHADPKIGDHGIALPVIGASGTDYVVHFLPLHGASEHPSLDDPRANVAIFIRKASINLNSGLQALTRRYDFTPRESEVLQAIVEVRGVPQVAALLGISPRTAKAHLQNIFAKTGTDRQVDLVKLVARFSGQA